MFFHLFLLRRWSSRSTSTRTQWSTWSPPRRTSFRMWRTTAASSTSLQKWAPPVGTRWPSPGPSWATTGAKRQRNTSETLQIRAVRHLPLSLTAVSMVMSATVHTHTLGAAAAALSFYPFVCETEDALQETKQVTYASFQFVSIFFCVWIVVVE